MNISISKVHNLIKNGDIVVKLSKNNRSLNSILLNLHKI